MSKCYNITDFALVHLIGIHTWDGILRSNHGQWIFTSEWYSHTRCELLLSNHWHRISLLVWRSHARYDWLLQNHRSGLVVLNWKSLKMSYCSQITDHAFSHLTGIHTLYINYCHQPTDNTFHIWVVFTLSLWMAVLKNRSLTKSYCLYSVRSLTWFSSGRDHSFIAKVLEHCERYSITWTGNSMIFLLF